MKYVDPFLFSVTELLDETINSIEMGGNRKELWEKLKAFREENGTKMSSVLSGAPEEHVTCEEIADEITTYCSVVINFPARGQIFASQIRDGKEPPQIVLTALRIEKVHPMSYWRRIKTD